MPNSTLIFAKRSLSLSKIQSGIGIFLASFGIVVLEALSVLAKDMPERDFLLPVPLMVFGILFCVTPVILLYVYDKNNGVLEYLLSLGWNQSDIFKRYLKASLFLALIIFIAEFAVNVIVSVIVGTQAVILLGLVVLAVTAALGFSAVSLVIIAMVAFSSLSKQRVGGNSPVALLLGILVIFPSWIVPYILPFYTGVLIDLFTAVFVGAVSIILLILSNRLIRREKMLP